MADIQPQLGFFKITVADATKAQRFYEQAFGMVASEPILGNGFREHVLKSPGNDFSLILFEKDGLEITRGNSYGPIGFNIADMDTALARAEAAGAKANGPPLTFGDVSYVFIESPDGHVIELIKRPD